MKDRVREAVFNLIGSAVHDKLVIDLFAGTGAVAFESLSRGAASAILVERRFPVARMIAQNAAQLGLSAQLTVVSSDAFVWAKRRRDMGDSPWLVFICPPYDFYVSRRADMVSLIAGLVQDAPADSLFVVESDERFDLRQLPQACCWDVRRYAPAVIAVLDLPNDLERFGSTAPRTGDAPDSSD